MKRQKQILENFNGKQVKTAEPSDGLAVPSTLGQSKHSSTEQRPTELSQAEASNCPSQFSYETHGLEISYSSECCRDRTTSHQPGNLKC